MRRVHRQQIVTHLVGLTVAVTTLIQPASAQKNQQGSQETVPRWVVRVEQVQKLPGKDPLLSLTPSEVFQSGKLFYIAYIPIPAPGPNADWQFFSLLRDIDKNVSPPKAAVIYRIKASVIFRGRISPDHVWDSQFSPDGESVLFKVGWPYERFSSYHLYLWNLKTKQLRQVLKEALIYRRVHWSPDSRYLAYLRGGDAEGNESQDGSPLRLYIHDLKTNKSSFVAQNRSVKSLSWTHHGTLLYSVMPAATQEAKQDDPRVKRDEPSMPSEAQQHLNRRPRPDIYEFPVTGGQPKLIIREGYQPVPSPDDKWIAFFGAPDADQAEQVAKETGETTGGPYLFIYSRADRKRFMVRPVTRPTKWSVLCWSPDSRRLLCIETKYKRGEAEAHIHAIDTATWTKQEVATLRAKDFEPISRLDTEPQFDTLQFSADGSFLFTKVEEVTGQTEYLYTAVVSLQAVDLRSGNVSTLAQVKDPTGLDWHLSSTVGSEAWNSRDLKSRPH